MVNSTTIDVDASANSSSSVIYDSSFKCEDSYISEHSSLSAIYCHSASLSKHDNSKMTDSSVWGSTGAATSISSNALGWGSYLSNATDYNKPTSNMQSHGTTSGSLTMSNNSMWGNSVDPSPQNSMQLTSGEADDHASTISSDSHSSLWQGMNFGTDIQRMGSTSDSWGATTSSNSANDNAKTTSNGTTWGASSPANSVWGSLASNSSANAVTSTVSGWPSASPVSTANNSVSGVSAWEKSNPSSQWGPAVSQSVWGATTAASNPPKTQPSTFAQAAGKGLNLKPTNGTNKVEQNTPPLTQAELLERHRKQEMQLVIDNPDGWGMQPVRQDYAWDVKVSPNTKRKQVEENKPNVWNNHNGTAIWEATKENPQVWSDSAEGSVKSQYDEDEQNIPSVWNGASGMKGGSDSSPSSWPAEKSQVQWPGANISQPPPGWNPSKNDNSSWSQNNNGNGVVKDRNSWNQPPPQSNDSTNWPPSIASEPKNTQWASNQNLTTVPNPSMTTLTTSNNSPGWGRSSPPISVKSDDGTHIWGSTPPSAVPNPQQQVNWGNEPNQWMNGQIKKTPMSSNTSQVWSDSSDPNWNGNGLRKPSESSWRDGSSYGSESDVFSETDTGTWNDPTNEANATWNSATGWKNRMSNINGTNRPPSSVRMAMPVNSGPPQMRVKLLQQLTDRGYKKEDALNALISNNMNLELAIAELRMNGILPDQKDGEIDVFIEGSRPPNKVNMTPTQQHMSSHDDMPSNAMPSMNHQMPPAMFNKNPSLNSSLGPQLTLQQKVLQQKMMNEPPPLPNGGLSMLGQVPPPPNVNHAAAQQVILNQIHLAFKSGFIDKTLYNQLLSQQLPKRLLILVQQLLQQITHLQSLVTMQQSLQQNKNGLNPMLKNQREEQCKTHIDTIKLAILQIQKKIKDEQTANVKASQLADMRPGSTVAGGDSMSDPMRQFENLNMAVSSQPQSRLSVWRQGPTPDREVDNADTKLLHQSHSSPNISTSFESLGYGDATWSTTNSGNWPTSTTTTTETSDVYKSIKPDAMLASDDGATFPPEFVPGKLWQGTANSNIEDDPHITPGSYTRSISVNTIKDDSLNNLAAKKSEINLKNDVAPTSLTSQLYGAGTNMSRPPPGLGQQMRSWGQTSNATNMQRQQSWAGSTGSAFTPVSIGMSQSWEKAPPAQSGYWILLRNLSSAFEEPLVQAICKQHGPLLQFRMANGQAVVQYAKKDQAVNAQSKLHNLVLGSVLITAEFISEPDVNKFIQTTMNRSGNMSAGVRRESSAATWNNTPAWNTTSSVWGGHDDNMNANNMIYNMLGNEAKDWAN